MLTMYDSSLSPPHPTLITKIINWCCIWFMFLVVHLHLLSQDYRSYGRFILVPTLIIKIIKCCYILFMFQERNSFLFIYICYTMVPLLWTIHPCSFSPHLDYKNHKLMLQSVHVQLDSPLISFITDHRDCLRDHQHLHLFYREI